MRGSTARSSSLVAIVLVLTTSTHAAADAGEADPDEGFELPDRAYLLDGGAVPYLYVPIALTLAIRSQTPPRSRPLLFKTTEGGEIYPGGQYPVPMLYVGAGLAAGTILAAGDDSRWFHLKGFAQGMAMNALLTSVAKNVFGRQRPSYDLAPGAKNPDDHRRSFWSGHSSTTLATATYLGLYARQHIFSRWREPGTLPWWEAASYAGLTAAALAVPYSQYRLNRHHASDVITGSLVGAGASTVFYIYQERRYRRARAARDRDEPRGFEWSVAPDPSINGFAISGSW
ncbi:MAG: phosphatase PAP2 family protein [Deltaproteobacteria bacterium]|nr:phosphatase PAP2 family protein [Kofleriaceae bacterium]